MHFIIIVKVEFSIEARISLYLEKGSKVMILALTGFTADFSLVSYGRILYIWAQFSWSFVTRIFISFACHC